MRMSLCFLRTSGVLEATGAVANDEFRGPLDFLSTSSYLPFSKLLREIYILDIFEVCEVCDAERLLVHRAWFVGKQRGLLLSQISGTISPPRSRPCPRYGCHRCQVTTHKILKDHFCFLILCLKFFKKLYFLCEWRRPDLF